MKRFRYACVLFSISLFAVTGCTTVEPWEKGYLAREEMMLTPDPLAATLSDHVFFSKEASSSGSSSSGSGCGCN
ncbi:MAG: DUF4266 domain-containing protein [Pseudomonadota bacterium]